MKSITRSFSILLVVSFILVTIYAAFELFGLPTDILKALDINETSKVEVARQVTQKAYWALGLDLLIIMLMIFMFSTYNLNHKAENIVYVEKDVTVKKSEAESSNYDEVLLLERLERFREQIDAITGDDESKVLDKAISALCKELQASTGAIYKTITEDGLNFLEFVGGFAFQKPDSQKIRYEFGEGLAGQAAKSGKELQTSSVPNGYITVFSGLGESTPNNLIILPIKQEDFVKGVVEIASFTTFSHVDVEFIRETSKIIIGLLETEDVTVS
ncbi:GAF domain-containing protein [Flammeovirgaceae bacterium SG7u.111]|nr:GAF domain-containing protein [Flammeovirgaceae bacterium SG7u.132]WPO34737.1 GAF domain-containing protein [Flammeovirgaceae bacterium SG7u.111]